MDMDSKVTVWIANLPLYAKCIRDMDIYSRGKK
jgi:hypothetical protein